MAKITVKPQTTYDQTPIIEGTVEFERFDSQRNPKHTIKIVVNYTPYLLFGGNLGLDETKNPNVWKLHFDRPLAPGTYDIEAYVIEVATDKIIASDDSVNELIIRQPAPAAYPKPKDMSLLQKFLLVNALMGTVDKLFGGKNGIRPIQSVHPVIDDQSSTSQFAAGAEERNQNGVVKNQEDRARANKNPNAKNDPYKATSGGGGSGGKDLNSMTDAEKKAAADLAIASQGGELADDGTIKMPDPIEELGKSDTLPTTDQVMEGLGISKDTQQPSTDQGMPVYDTLGNFTGTYETPTTQPEFNPGGQSGLGGTFENIPQESFPDVSPTSTPEQVDAALRNAATSTNFDPKVIEDTVYNAYR